MYNEFREDRCWLCLMWKKREKTRGVTRQLIKKKLIKPIEKEFYFIIMLESRHCHRSIFDKFGWLLHHGI